MRSVRLVRVSEWLGATLGVLVVDGKPEYKTLELPWKDNQDNISCVPPGTYICEKYPSPKHKKVVLLLRNVPGRDLVQIHIANKAYELLGCIAIGLSWGTEGGEAAVWESEKAFNRLMESLRNDDVVELQIVSAIE